MVRLTASMAVCKKGRVSYIGVLDGQAVSATVTNPAFINKNIDDAMGNKLGFNRLASGSNIADIQQAVNNIYSATGVSESQTGTVYNAPANTISNGDPYQTALSELAFKFAATGHDHDGTNGNGPEITAAHIASVPLLGYLEQPSNISAATGSSNDVTSILTGKSASSNSTTPGIPITSPNNKVRLLNSDTGQEMIDASGNVVYGRITFSSSIWTLRFYVLSAGAEISYTFASSTNIAWFYEELFNPLNAPPVYNLSNFLFGSNPSSTVPTASTSVFGKVELSNSAADDVASAGTIGTTNGIVANADHAHQGVHSIAGTGGQVYGDVLLQGSGGSNIKQASQTFTVDSPALSATTPADVASAGAVGTGVTSARSDHAHKGVHSVAGTGAQLFGDVILAAGTGINISQSGQTLTVIATGGGGGGSVSSVGLTDASTNPIFSITNSPVTGSGVLTETLFNQSANTFFLGPSSGGADQPNFRAPVSADFPTAAFVAPTVTSLSSTGTTTGWLFTISTSTTCAVNDTYTNNGHTYTVLAALSAQSGQVLFMSGASTPTASGTLTRSAGAGTSSVSFTASTALATYTTPTSPRGPVYLKVRMIGGGAGGTGSGTGGSGGTGGNGGTTTFGSLLLIANGGLGTTQNSGVSGVGGTASLGTGPLGFAFQGGAGGANGDGINGESGGNGAYTPFGGGAGYGGGFGNAGSAAVANSGAGGGGSGGFSTGSGQAGGGGGGYIDAIITSPAGTYVYCIGSAGSLGTAGTSGFAGGAGGSGYIIVEEHYQ